MTTGNAFDIVSNKYVNNRTSTTNGYNADMTLNVTNRATKDYNFEIQLTNNYGDNCNIVQNSAFANSLWRRINANLFSIQTTIKPNTTLTVNWREIYVAR